MKCEKINTLFGEQTWASKRFQTEDNPLDHWEGMPEFDPCEPPAYHTVQFEFEKEEDIIEFGKLIGQKLRPSVKSVWIPQERNKDHLTARWASDRSEKHQPKYPIFIPSKGRWEIRPTSDHLISYGIKHYIVVEESQLEEYKKHVDPEWVTLLILDQKYLDNYDTCDDLGATKSKGPGAARNFAWDYSIKLGFKRHWVMDDNINGFFRFNKEHRILISDGAMFRAMEDHADQYTNVCMSGPNYKFFAIPTDRFPPYCAGTRIYSCNLILNEIPQRWRGRYNEDTILSLDILKAGGCTMQYYAFLQNKMGTQVLKGGNSDEFYLKEGTKPKSKMLVDVHPDVSKLKWKFSRWHHEVNYRPFKNNRLIRAENAYINPDPEYGMSIIQPEKKDGN